MRKKIASISLILYISIFSSCSNKSIKPKPSPNQQNETIKESSLVGKILVGALTLYGTGNVGKAIKSSKFAGNASGYFVGKKLSDMQKRYQAKEEELIADILLIDQESIDLKKRSEQLSTELTSMQSQVEELQSNRDIKESEKIIQNSSVKTKLLAKKEELQSLLKKNKAVSKKISFSKNKVKEYEYKKEDRAELLKSVNILAKSSQADKAKILEEIASIDRIIDTL